MRHEPVVEKDSPWVERTVRDVVVVELHQSREYHLEASSVNKEVGGWCCFDEVLPSERNEWHHNQLSKPLLILLAES